MTPDDQQLLSSYGEDVYLNVCELIVEFTGYGIFLLGLCVAVHIMLHKPHHPLLIKGSLSVIFICFTWIILGQGGYELTQVLFALVRTSVEGIAAQGQTAFDKDLPWQYQDNWPITVNLLLGDFIVAWRAWKLFQHEKLWKIVLLSLLLANVGINIADCIWNEIDIVQESTGIGQRSTLDWLSPTMSLAINLCATLMITWKTWNHHRMMADSSHIQSRAINILLVLIESGVIFCLIQVVYLSLNVVDMDTSDGTAASSLTFQLALEAVTGLQIIAAPLYPLAVFILIGIESSPVMETIHLTQESNGTVTTAELA
ncbi:hypothetical protein GYMLUDRAFT_250717 [Collybiopsis luxurians FD-317 M1]|uniref:Uncharacterized protein n=1 Tax=Collybiopsis luxurians FD-317 M1 TaxID=944289 RepID=A0A0D0ARP6_9AGAR|nr:hypothetical protein GYMLUDRAFT_250717 [Collybiopsis luxurians FD-317 M1]